MGTTIEMTRIGKRDSLTIRDQLAMSALSALGFGSWNGSPLNMCYEEMYRMCERLSICAYKIADAMMLVRGMDTLPTEDELHDLRMKDK